MGFMTRELRLVGFVQLYCLCLSVLYIRPENVKIGRVVGSDKNELTAFI